MGLLDIIRGLSGASAGTPPFFPGTGGAPSPGLLGGGGFGGLLSSLPQRLSTPQAQLGAMILANSGGQAGGIGQAIAGYGQQQREAEANKLRDEYLRAQIEAMKRPPKVDATNDIQEYEFAKKNGYTGTFADWKTMGKGQGGGIGQYNPGDYTPRSFAKFLASGMRDPSVLERQYAPPPAWIGAIGGGIGAIPRTPGGGVGGPTMITSPEEEQAAAAARAAAEAAARETGQASGQRAATFKADLAVIDDEIARTNKLLTEFRAGKYQTGTIAGMLPNWRTPAQELRREQGKDVLKSISSATFGALSEGERAFLKDLGVSENNNEEANISLLEERLKALDRARRRLSDGGDPAANQMIQPGQSTTINGVKVTRKK